jgi:hypothetical protein
MQQNGSQSFVILFFRIYAAEKNKIESAPLQWLSSGGQPQYRLYSVVQVTLMKSIIIVIVILLAAVQCLRQGVLIGSKQSPPTDLTPEEEKAERACKTLTCKASYIRYPNWSCTYLTFVDDKPYIGRRTVSHVGDDDCDWLSAFSKH